jgi:hypothetical protein
MNVNAANQFGIAAAAEKACEDCGNKEGDPGADGAPVKVEPFQGQMLCSECIEALAYALQSM